MEIRRSGRPSGEQKIVEGTLGFTGGGALREESEAALRTLRRASISRQALPSEPTTANVCKLGYYCQQSTARPEANGQ
jgi:hypothetical protein